MRFKVPHVKISDARLTFLGCEVVVDLLPGVGREIAVLAVLLLVRLYLLSEAVAELLLAEVLPQGLDLVVGEDVGGVGLNDPENARGRNATEDIHDDVDW